MNFGHLGENPKVINLNGQVKLVKTRTQKTFVDQDIAVVDMLTLNYLTLKQKFRLSTKTLRAGSSDLEDGLKYLITSTSTQNLKRFLI